MKVHSLLVLLCGCTATSTGFLSRILQTCQRRRITNQSFQEEKVSNLFLREKDTIKEESSPDIPNPLLSHEDTRLKKELSPINVTIDEGLPKTKTRILKRFHDDLEKYEYKPFEISLQNARLKNFSFLENGVEFISNLGNDQILNALKSNDFLALVNPYSLCVNYFVKDSNE